MFTTPTDAYAPITNASKPVSALRRRFPKHVPGRPRTKLRIALAIITPLAVLGLVLLAASRYQPLTPKMYGYYDSRVLTSAGTAVPFYNSKGPHSDQVWLEPKGAFTVEIEMTIDNNGPFPIRVENVGAHDASSRPKVFFDRFGEYGLTGATPMHPFIIVGHSTATLAVHYVEQCVPSATGNVITVAQLPVTFSFLHFEHTDSELIEPFQIKRRPSC
ncbi:MAG TPA: hypothetical protein VIJ99_08690 [Acidimicrobiales bacterium]